MGSSVASDIQGTVARAASGDAEGAALLLTQFAAGERIAQTRIATALRASTEPSLWEYLLEYAALGSWAGEKVGTPAMRRNLRLKLYALFVSDQRAPSARSREEALLRGLDSPQRQVRRLAADLLGEWGSHKAVEPLTGLLRDPASRVRWHAARALGRIGDGRGVPALIEALGHSDDLIAGEATEALALIGGEAVPSLLKSLRHRDARVRWHAARALALICDPRCIEPLIERLDDDNFGVRWLAAEGLACIGVQALVPLLRSLLTAELTPWMAEAVIHVLHNIKDPMVGPLVHDLERSLRDSYANVEVPVEAKRVLERLERRGAS
jgi:HEAT repeat protein